MRKRIKKYNAQTAFKLRSGTLKGLEVLADKKRISLSELIRNCVVALLERKKI